MTAPRRHPHAGSSSIKFAPSSWMARTFALPSAWWRCSGAARIKAHDGAGAPSYEDAWDAAGASFHTEALRRVLGVAARRLPDAMWSPLATASCMGGVHYAARCL